MGDMQNAFLPLAVVKWSICRSLAAFRVEQDLGASIQGDRLPVGFARDLGVPDLGGASAVDETRSAAHAAFATCAEKIRLQLGRGKTRGAARQAIQTSETGRSIRERHDGGGV
jgi:hypothetical protein